jgi:hypothetical protein
MASEITMICFAYEVAPPSRAWEPRLIPFVFFRHNLESPALFYLSFSCYSLCKLRQVSECQWFTFCFEVTVITCHRGYYGSQSYGFGQLSLQNIVIKELRSYNIILIATKSTKSPVRIVTRECVWSHCQKGGAWE